MISFYEGQGDNAPRTVDLTWRELADLLASPRVTACEPCPVDLPPEEQQRLGRRQCAAKEGQAWSPAVMRPGCTRANASVQAIHYLVYDIDHASLAEAVAVAGKLEGLQCLLHSSHSHRPRVDPARLATPEGARLPAEDCAVRVVIALLRSLSLAEFPTAWRAAAEALDLRVQDEQCKDPSRLYFLPSCPASRLGEFLFVESEGVPLDPDRVLARARSAPPERPRMLGDELDLGDLPPDPVSVDLDSLRDRLREVRRKKARRGDDKYALLDRIIRGRPFCVPGHAPGTDGEWRKKGMEKGRQSAIHRAASLVAFCLPSHAPSGAALELLRPCLEKSDLDPEGMAHWLSRAQESYDCAMSARVERDLERARISEALRANFARSAGAPDQVRALATEQQVALAGALAGAQAEAPITEDEAAQARRLANWRDLLLKNRDGASIRQTAANAYAILALDENLRGTLRFDAVEKEIVVEGGPFSGVRQDVLSSEVQDWLVRNYDLQVSIESVEVRILRVAYENEVDPLRDYLESLAWDGVPRLDEMLLRYAGAISRTADGAEIEGYVRQVTRKWMVGGVARALEPGCQMDTALVLEGPLQGEGKTSFCRIMGGKWAATTTLVLGDKDTSQLVSTSWLTELGELRSFLSADTESMRSFLTLTEDRFRQPYGRGPRRFARRAFFVGTTNRETYLRDLRERRIWPVRVGDFDLGALARDRDQLWAEAVTAFRAFRAAREAGVSAQDNPERWWFNRHERRVADEQAAERAESTHFEAKLAKWWSGCRRRPEVFTTSYIAEEVLRFPTDRVTHAVVTEVGAALRRMGFQKARGMLEGHKQWYYRATEELLAAPVAVTSSHIASLVAGAQVKKEEER